MAFRECVPGGGDTAGVLRRDSRTGLMTGALPSVAPSLAGQREPMLLQIFRAYPVAKPLILIFGTIVSKSEFQYVNYSIYPSKLSLDTPTFG